MNGPQHYTEAERLVQVSVLHTDSTDPRDLAIAELSAAQAQVHATLAGVAASLDESRVRLIMNHDAWGEAMK